MEERLHVLENQNKTPYLCKDVNWKAFTLMQVWFNKNIHHPYPSNKDIQEISKNGNISEGQFGSTINNDTQRHHIPVHSVFMQITESSWFSLG
jgi:hypothetical protein